MNASKTLLFFGDSITDCGRKRDEPKSLGNGFVAEIGARLTRSHGAGAPVLVNMGISGNRIRDLEGRVARDVIPWKPNVVTILIGINDTWARYRSRELTPPEEFRERYDRLLKQLRSDLDARLILMEPFVLPVPPDRRVWREDLNPRIDIVRDLAWEHRAALVPLDGLFAAAAARAPAGEWAGDGVHPTALGHSLIADAWFHFGSPTA